MLKSFDRCGLEVIIVRHAVLHAHLVANQSAGLALPAGVKRTMDHTILSDREQILVTIKDLLVVHYLGFGTGRHQDDLADVPLEE